MASSMPLPVPPRTPTPPPDDQEEPVGLGLQDAQQYSPTKLGFSYHADTLSPLSATFPSNGFGSGSLAAPSPLQPSQRTPLSPASSTFPYSPMSATGSENETPLTSASVNGNSENVRNPFNFQTVQYTAGKPAIKSVRICASLQFYAHDR